METQTKEKIKKIIMTELPVLVENDPEIRKFILSVTAVKYADKSKTEIRIDRVLDELKRNREAQEKKWIAWEKKEAQKWNAQEKKWVDQNKKQDEKWVDQIKKQDEKWVDQIKKQDEKWADQIKKQDEKWVDHNKKQDEKWDAQEKKWVAWEKKWEENQKVIREMLVSIKTTNNRIDSTIGALGSRWGLHAEGSFRNALKGILEESFGVKVERYEDYDHEGVIFGRPDQVELDLIIYNNTLILCEIKSSISKSQMYTFWRKKNFYEEKHNRKVNRVIVISPMVDDNARPVAKNLGIEVYSYAEDVKK